MSLATADDQCPRLTLLVDDDEALVCSVAEFLLQLDHLADAVVDELPLGLDQFLTLLGRLVEEARVDLAAGRMGTCVGRLSSNQCPKICRFGWEMTPNGG